MSSVYRARDRVLERQVAVKLLHEQYAADEGAVERFRREATSVAQLAHPHVVGVIDRGEDGRRQFIVFELIDGPNLKEVVRERGPLPVGEALGYAIQVGSALGFAHEQGLVHRDVKPQNVLLAPDGSARVTDFGIARDLEMDGLTQTGTVLGTSEYVAPEQARGELVGPATDIYALGVVLFELLAGDPPFTGASFVDIALRHVNDPVPSIRARRPDVPWRLDTAIARALAKSPGDRFASMAAFVAELETCLAEVGDPAAGQDAPTMLVPGLTQVAGAVGPAAGEGAARIEPGVAATRAVRRLLRGTPAGRSRSRWPLVAGLAGLAVAAAVAVVVAVLTDGNGPGGGTSVTLKGVASYDPPPGDGREHNELIALATDGNPATAWRTERYGAALDVIGKRGVGLVLDAGSPVALPKLAVVTDTPGFTAEILAGDAPGGPFVPVAPPLVVAARSVFTPDNASISIEGSAPKAKRRYYVVWITKLKGDTAHINEVTAP